MGDRRRRLGRLQNRRGGRSLNSSSITFGNRICVAAALAFPQAFLFTNRADAAQFTAFAIKANEPSRSHAVCHDSSMGPAFGNYYGRDLSLLRGRSGTVGDGNHSLGTDYDFSGKELTGASSGWFSVEDVEVFAV